MSMTDHYKSNVRDIFFNLFEVQNIGATSLGKGPFTSMDEDSVRDAIVGMDVFVRAELAPSFAESDHVPLTLDEQGSVTLPPKRTTVMIGGSWKYPSTSAVMVHLPRLPGRHLSSSQAQTLA